MGLSTAKATVSATAAGKNPNVSYAWQGARNHGANTMTGRTVTSKTGQHSFTIKAPVFSPELDALLISLALLVKVVVLLMKKLYNKLNMMLSMDTTH